MAPPPSAPTGKGVGPGCLAHWGGGESRPSGCSSRCTFVSCSSSCSCDSCCPSSLCSSSMSAPITYETDTSHASTPGEATPPRLDVREQSAAAKERRSLPDSGTGPGAVRDQEALGPSGPLLTEPPLQYCPPSAPASPCPTTPPAEAPATAEAPPLAEGPPDSPAGSVSSGPSSPDSDSPTSPPYLGSSRTFCRRSVGPGPDPLAAGSPGHPPPDPGPCLDSAALDPGPASILGSSGFPAMRNLPQAPGETWSNTFPAALVQDPGPAGPHASGTPSPQRRDSLAAGPGPASTCPSSSWSQSPDLAPASPSPGARPCPAPAPDRAAAEAGLLVPGPDPPSPARGSRPAITVETESCGPFSPGSPPALTSSSVPATILLLDPLSAPPQAGRGGQASSLSPSPRPTQSPPKQTLFSPCVDVFEAEPLSWEDGEEEEEENEDDEEDVAADESQYRHRRLTGDSGIEVCRCRVDEDGEAEGPERKECTRRGGHGERDRKGRASSRLHDSVDCPARGQRQGGDTPTRTPPSEGADKAVVVVETV